MSKFIEENLLVNCRPDLEELWDFEKNGELGLDFYKMTKGSDRKVWWYCSKCDDSYDMVIKCKARMNQNCPYCAGKRVNHTNSLASVYPEIASEWHPTKNGKWTPHNVTHGKPLKVWWIGSDCGHEWEASIDNRTSHLQKCPYCSPYNKRILVGFNDMASTNPRLASLLAEEEDGYKYTQSSGNKVDWQCPSCEEIIKNKRIADINRYGLSCPKCSDGVSFNEKFVSSLLNQLNINFERQATFNWSEDRRYDFYIPDYSLIIETHGKQHYQESGFSEMSGISLEEQQENDRYKHETAINNGVEHYIVIDCRLSELEWIKNNILNSELEKLFCLDNIDWVECNRYATKSLVIEVCNYWKDNNQPSTELIAKIFKISRSTAIGYLKQGKKNGWCEYNATEESKNAGLRRYKKIVQLDINGHFIKEWDYASQASEDTDINISGIRHACRGINKTSGGFKWMYKEDYDKLIESK